MCQHVDTDRRCRPCGREYGLNAVADKAKVDVQRAGSRVFGNRHVSGCKGGTAVGPLVCIARRASYVSGISYAVNVDGVNVNVGIILFLSLDNTGGRLIRIDLFDSYKIGSASIEKLKLSLPYLLEILGDLCRCADVLSINQNTALEERLAAHITVLIEGLSVLVANVGNETDVAGLIHRDGCDCSIAVGIGLYVTVGSVFLACVARDRVSESGCGNLFTVFVPERESEGHGLALSVENSVFIGFAGDVNTAVIFFIGYGDSAQVDQVRSLRGQGSCSHEHGGQ